MWEQVLPHCSHYNIPWKTVQQLSGHCLEFYALVPRLGLTVEPRTQAWPSGVVAIRKLYSIMFIGCYLHCVHVAINSQSLCQGCSATLCRLFCIPAMVTNRVAHYEREALLDAWHYPTLAWNIHRLHQFMVRIDLAVSWLAMLINLSETTRARVWSLGSSTPLHNRTSNHFLYPYHKQCRWVMHWFYLILLVRYLLKSLKSIFFREPCHPYYTQTSALVVISASAV